MPRTRMCGQNGTTTTRERSSQARQDLSVSATQTRLSKKRGDSSSMTSTSRRGTKWMSRQTNEQQPVLNTNSLLTQADLPQIIKAVSTFFSVQLQHPSTTAPEDASTPDNKSEHHLIIYVDKIYI